VPFDPTSVPYQDTRGYVVAPAPPPPATQPAPLATVATGQGLTEADVRKLVDEALKAREDRKKAEEDQKKAQPQWYQVGTILNMNANWRDGLWFETPNRDFTFHLMGAVQYDLALYTNDASLNTGPRPTGPFVDGANLRRGRVRAEGSMWEVVDYRFEMEFFNGVTPVAAVKLPPAQDKSLATQVQTFVTPGPTEAWLTLTHLPILGNVRVGNQKEPISLEHLEGFRFLPFLERSPLFDFLTPTAFNNGFTPGILLFDTAFNEHMTWAIGGFKNSYDVYGFGLGDGEYAVTGRLTWLPWYEDNGARMLHLGVSGSHRDPIDNQVRFRVRTSDRNAPSPLTPLVNVLVDTGFLKTTSEDLMGLEAFLNLGSLTIQAEYQSAWCQNTARDITSKDNVGTTFFGGYYVQALYWLTGEYTRWDKKAAAPTRYVPNNPFFLVSGPDGWINGTGAWQVGLRWSQLDLNSRGINGGMLDDLTVGVNWILNPNAKFQFNYDWERRYGLSAGNGNMQALGMRMQFDF
jgi:phosphate-selective porin OprO/OprP